MPDALRHVSIHCGSIATDQDRPATVDVTLPAAMTVGQLLPAIVDAVGAGKDRARHWRLSVVGGPLLNESMTLAQNDIHDGDLLMLDETAISPPRTPRLTQALQTHAPNPEISPLLRPAGCLWGFLLGALTLIGTNPGGAGRIAVAAVLTLAVIAAALFAHRTEVGETFTTTLNVAVVGQVAVLGFLVVPAGPGPANVFLATVAASSSGVVAMRLSRCGTEVLLAIVTLSAIGTVAAGCALIWPLSLQSVGAILAAAALAALSLTPRLSIALAGLTPTLDGDIHNDVSVEALASRGHRTLTGLVAGCCATAALGTLIVAAGGRDPATAAAIGFTAAVGVALFLRSRSHVSGRCRTALTASACCALTAMFVLVVAWSPAQATWAGALSVAAGLAVLSPATLTNAMAVRIVDGVEYCALAAVVPLACWLTGVFDALRGVGGL